MACACCAVQLLLTGHLDFIILTNEKEKAKKLKELERQLFGKGAGAEAEPERQTQVKAVLPHINGTTTAPPAAVRNVIEEVKAPSFGGFGGEDDAGGGKR